MYLKKIYHTNKWWFIVILLFIIVQLGMDIRQDISLSPVYHYGMFSNVILPEKHYTVTEITVNDKKLQSKDLSPYRWDKIILAANLYHDQKNWNSLLWNTDIKRMLHLSDSSKYINNISPEEFNAWYKNYLQGVLHTKADSVSIDFIMYDFNGQNLVKTNN